MNRTIDQEQQILTELQRRKQLFTSLFFTTLSDQEMNLFISHMMMWTIAAEKITETIVNGLEADSNEICAGSGVFFPSTSKSVLCYCGRTFHPRFDIKQKTWSIRKHTR